MLLAIAETDTRVDVTSRYDMADMACGTSNHCFELRSGLPRECAADDTSACSSLCGSGKTNRCAGHEAVLNALWWLVWDRTGSDYHTPAGATVMRTKGNLSTCGTYVSLSAQSSGYGRGLAVAPPRGSLGPSLHEQTASGGRISMKNPLISVIMPSYNHALYISAAIESVLSQTVGDLELV